MSRKGLKQCLCNVLRLSVGTHAKAIGSLGRAEVSEQGWASCRNKKCNARMRHSEIIKKHWRASCLAWCCALAREAKENKDSKWDHVKKQRSWPPEAFL